MKLFIVFMTLMLCLTGGGATVASDLVTSGSIGFGKDIDGVGGALTIGIQGSNPTTVVRAQYTSVNYGNELDNLGAMLINYWLLDNLWKGFKIGQRTSLEYEVVDKDVALATGIEFVKTISANTGSICASIDVVKRNDIQYLVASVGLIVKIPAKKK